MFSFSYSYQGSSSKLLKVTYRDFVDLCLTVAQLMALALPTVANRLLRILPLISVGSGEGESGFFAVRQAFATAVLASRHVADFLVQESRLRNYN